MEVLKWDRRRRWLLSVQKQTDLCREGESSGRHEGARAVRPGAAGGAGRGNSPAQPMLTAEKRMLPTLVRKKTTTRLARPVPMSFSRSEIGRPLITRGSVLTTKRYVHREPMPGRRCGGYKIGERQL